MPHQAHGSPAAHLGEWVPAVFLLRAHSASCAGLVLVLIPVILSLRSFPVQ
jgi:hypothetical protein